LTLAKRKPQKQRGTLFGLLREGRGLLIAASELEEEIGRLAVYGKITGFINDHEAGVQVGFALALTFLELVR